MSGGDNINSISISNGTIIRFSLIILGFFLIWYLRDLMLIILTSIVLASFVESVVPYLKKLKLGRVLGVVLLYIISLFIMAGFFYLFAPILITEVHNLSVSLSSFMPNSEFINYFQSDAFSGAKDIVKNLTHSLSLADLLDTSRAFVANLSKGFFQTLSVVFGNIFNLILIIIISFYLSIQENGIENFLKIILPSKYENYAIDLWIRSRKKIALWLKGQMLISLIVGILVFLVLSLLDIDYAFIFAIIAGVMQIIPYGLLISAIPVVVFSYLSDGITSAIMVAGAYLIINQFESFLFTPLIIKRVTGLSPLIIILALLAGFQLSGFWGMILSIPCAVLIMELISDIEKRKTVKKLDHES